MKKYDYDITIIVPIYNTQEYLCKCLDSLVNQKYDSSKIQIILLNDGSKDNSKQISEEYKSKYKNIELIDKENTGVSDTRNMGIRNSKGKYILFVDSDDYISLNTCGELFSFFEKNYYDIDLVSYCCYNVVGKKIYKHFRNKKYFNKTGIYDLIKNPEYIQATCRIMIKNGLDVFFDSNQRFSEDEKFSTEIVMKRKKIGYCDKAIYYYNIREGNANHTTVYEKEVMMYTYKYYNEILNAYNKDPYIQELFINTLRWRINEYSLLTSGNNEELFKLLKENVNLIDTSLVKKDKEISDINKLLIMKLSSNKIDAKITKDSCNIMINDSEFIRQKSIPIRIYKYYIKNNKLIIKGEIYSPIFEYVKPKIYIYNKDNIKEINITKSNYLCYSKEYNIKLYKFECELNVKEIESIKFIIEVNNTKFNTHFSSNGIINKYINYNNRKIVIGKNSIVFRCYNIHDFALFIKKTIITIKYPKELLWRLKYLFYNKKNKILLCYEDIDASNFKNRFDKIIYVKKDNKNNEKDTIIYGSKLHKKCFIKSSSILISKNKEEYYYPFDKSISFIRDIINNKIIFLYNGQKDDMLNCENNICDKVLIREKEYEKYVIDYLNYSKDDIIKL